MSLRQRKSKIHYAKPKRSKKNPSKFWKKFARGFSSKAQARRALQSKDSDIILGEEE
tara:strand:- start:154 stop:324 length:171 start_codon:yes stop_codon:yes gene_type:complete